MKLKSLLKRAASCLALLVLGMGYTMAQSNQEIYEVKAGDTIYGISYRFGITQEALRASNPVLGQGNDIFVGQRLVIPPVDSQVEEVTTTTTTSVVHTTTTTTTTIVTRWDVDNTLFLKGDLVVTGGIGIGSVKRRGVNANQTRATYTQQLALDYCFMDDVLQGSALGLGIIVNSGFGGRYAVNYQKFRREDLTVMATVSLHHQFVDQVDTYVKAGFGVSSLTDEYKYDGYECTYANPSLSIALLVGARYYLGDQWGVCLEAGLPAANFNHAFGSSFNFLTCGLCYRF